MKKKTVNSYWLVLVAPLLAFPFMINLRVFPFIAPNEEPKWAVLTVCALWMGLAAAYIWFKQKEPIKISSPSIPAILLGIFTFILAIGIFIGPNQTEGFIRFSFWFFCILIFIASAWAMNRTKKWMNALTWSVSVGTFIFSLRYWEGYFLDYGKPNYNIHVLFSPIGHVNFTGDVLIILLPFLIWALATHQNTITRVLNWFSVATLLTILLVASSRGALGAITLSILIATLLALKHRKYLKRNLNKQTKLSATLILSAFITSAIVYTSLPYHYRDLARISASAGQTVTGAGKVILSENALQPPLVDMWVQVSPLLGARTPIFASTTAMTLDAPLLGQGTGNFAWVYPNYSNRYPDFRDSLSSVRTFTTNPHNVVLQIASQNGIPAMFIFMGLLLYFWYQLFKSSWKKWNVYTLSGLSALTAAIFDAMFNHVFFNPASMFVFALLGGSWWAVVNKPSPNTLYINPKLTALVIACLILLLSMWPTRWVVSEYYTGLAMKSAQHPVFEPLYYQKAYAWDKENFRAAFGMGQVAYKQKKYAESAHYFKAFESFYPYNPPALNMLGAAYMMSGQYQPAKDAFDRAITIYPGFEMAEQNKLRAQAILNQQKTNQNRVQK